MLSFLAVIIIAIGYAHAAVTCTGHRPIKPVCGSDGNLYYNECHMKDEVYGVSKTPVYPVGWKECLDTSCLQICTRERDPVCGSNGEISSNPCTFLWDQACGNDEQIYEVDMESCLAKKCPQQCAANDEKCSLELKSCRFRWSGILEI